MALPRITVVTPSFNQGRFVEASLQSVLDQDYGNLEYLVLDGGSTDGSVEIIRKYASRLSYWRSAPDKGQADAIAEGFERSTGDVLAWLNSDDVLLPGTLRRVAQEFAEHPEVGVVYGSRLFIDESGGVLSRYTPPTVISRLYFSFGQWIPQECSFWRRSAYEACGGIDRSLYFSMDFSLLVRLWSVTRFRNIHAFLGAMRIHSEAKSARATHIMEAEGAVVRRAERIPEVSWRPLERVITRAIYAQGRCEATVRRLFGRP